MFRPAASASVFDLDGVEILLHHQHQHQHYHHHHHHQPGVFPGLYALENATFFNQDNGGLNLNGEASPAALQPKPAAKKDRHSKINTAQGPRDRRVRLSIGIARKFFDLQELLGFDKPSKTLDWLLTKSKEAIRDLVQTKQKASSSPSECELISSENGGDRQLAAPSLTKQSRAKARARARERTLEKLCIKQLGGAGSRISSSNVKIMSSGVCEVNIPHCPFRSEAERQDLIEESIVIKRKSKNPSLFGYQQNLVFSRELDSNYIIPSANASENGDVYGFASQSNLHAILDQHKFINSNSNI